METIKGFISVSDLTHYKNADINKNNSGEPIILEIWKDGDDYQLCCKGIHLKKVEIIIKEI
jgi:hypothetical protein